MPILPTATASPFAGRRGTSRSSMTDSSLPMGLQAAQYRILAKLDIVAQAWIRSHALAGAHSLNGSDAARPQAGFIFFGGNS